MTPSNLMGPLVRSMVDAIRDYLQPQGTRRPHINVLTWLYFNQYIARRVIQGFTNDRYTTEHSLFSRQVPEKPTRSNSNTNTIPGIAKTTV